MKSSNNTQSGSIARKQRREDAEVRAQSRAQSTDEEQIQILALRPGASAREVARLTARLAKQA